MRDDIRQAKITTKPRFENAHLRFYHELIPKAAMMKGIPTSKHHEETKVWELEMSLKRGLVGNFEHVT